MLTRPTSPVDVSTLQATVDSLRTDIDTILKARVPEFVDPTEDIVLVALFATSEIPPPPLESMPIVVGVERRMKIEHRRRSTVRWRLR